MKDERKVRVEALERGWGDVRRLGQPEGKG